MSIPSPCQGEYRLIFGGQLALINSLWNYVVALELKIKI